MTTTPLRAGAVELAGSGPRGISIPAQEAQLIDALLSLRGVENVYGRQQSAFRIRGFLDIAARYDGLERKSYDLNNQYAAMKHNHESWEVAADCPKCAMDAELDRLDREIDHVRALMSAPLRMAS